jgi:hypothetical protein
MKNRTIQTLRQKLITVKENSLYLECYLARIKEDIYQIEEAILDAEDSMLDEITEETPEFFKLIGRA